MGNNREMEHEMESNEAMVDELNGEVLDGDARGVTEAGQESQGTSSGFAQESALQAELVQVAGERDQYKDRLARLQAEFDNARKREQRERQDAREYTVSSTVEPFLGVMDNFQLALKSQSSAEQLRAGVELILKQMEDALKGLNVVAVESVGAQFDPRIHEALGSIETAEFPDHQVMEEIRRGYKIREKLLRPALVRIASNPAQVSD
jgi:molecular chaperone GrpE